MTTTKILAKCSGSILKLLIRFFCILNSHEAKSKVLSFLLSLFPRIDEDVRGDMIELSEAGGA